MLVTENYGDFSRFFLIDYENVNRDGLNGIVKLTEKDCVRIYYSDAASTMTFGLHRRINTSKAHFDYIKVQIPIKNAIDCQILFDIRDIAKFNRDAEYHIVSRDSDFDHAVSDFCNRGLKVRKIPEICNPEPSQPEVTVTAAVKVQTKKAPMSKREAQVRSFFGQQIKDPLYTSRKEEIIQVILRANTKQQLNNGLMKLYPKEVGALYKLLKPLSESLPSQ